MKKLLAVRCLLLAVCCSLFALYAHASALVPLSTTTEFTSTAIARFRAYHGETVRLTHRLTLAGAPLDLSGASARFYWRTEEMADWWSTDATLEADSVWCDFTPEMDPGTEAIWYFFGITQANAIAYRANGSLTLLDSPGFTPADLGEPDALAAALEALFKEADTRYTTKEELSALAREQTANSEQLTANSEQLTAHSEQLTALEAALEGKAEADHAHADLEAALEEKVSLITTTPPAVNNNADCYGYRGTLKTLGVTSTAANIRRITILTRASGNLNASTPHWARVVKKEGGNWAVVAQSTTSRCWSDVPAGSELSWEMEPALGLSLPTAEEDIAIVWVNSATAAAKTANGLISFQTVPLKGGLTAALPSSPTASYTTAAWSPRITLTYEAAYPPKVDTSLSSTSTNPVQNKAVYSALNGKVDKPSFDSFKVYFNADNTANPYVKSYGDSMHTLKTIFDSNNDADNWAEKFDNAKITFEWWHQYSGVKEDSLDVPISAFKALANGGGGNTEVWKGNVGFGEQDTFFGPKAVASGEGQFYKGYPRLHNHGQDIHEVSGFSRDSKDTEDVWSHRLLLPWDLAKANDTSYLMAGVIWESIRLAGVNCKFVQPLLPTNTPEATSALGLPYALPCFENSPIYWNGHLIYRDDTYPYPVAPKQIKMPWNDISEGETVTLPIIAKDNKVGIVGLSIKGEDNLFHIYSHGDSVSFQVSASTEQSFSKSVPTTSVTDALSSRINALESGGGSSLTPTLEVATWSGTVCSVPWGTNPLLIDCSGQTEHDFTIQFPVADWPEGAARLLFIRATPTPTVGDGIIDSVKGGNGLLTPSVVGYDYLEQGEEHTVSAWRRGSRLRLMVVDRERLSDL